MVVDINGVAVHRAGHQYAVIRVRRKMVVEWHGEVPANDHAVARGESERRLIPDRLTRIGGIKFRDLR